MDAAARAVCKPYGNHAEITTRPECHGQTSNGAEWMNRMGRKEAMLGVRSMMDNYIYQQRLFYWRVESFHY